MKKDNKYPRVKKYQIYNASALIFILFPVIEAKSVKEAIMKYLKGIGKSYKLKRSKDRNVALGATPFYERDRNKYKDGNAVWYKIVE